MFISSMVLNKLRIGPRVVNFSFKLIKYLSIYICLSIHPSSLKPSSKYSLMTRADETWCLFAFFKINPFSVIVIRKNEKREKVKH